MLGILLWLAGVSSGAHAQDFQAAATDNYAGTLALEVNPAFLAESRYAFHMTLAGFHTEFANDYLAFRRRDFLNNLGQLDIALGGGGEGGTQDGILTADNTQKDKQILFRTNIVLPSFQFRLKDGSGVAFTLRQRTLFSLQGVDYRLARLAREDFRYEPYLDSLITSNNLAANTLSFLEIGLGYGRTIWDGGQHYISGGGRLKLLLGIGGAYLHSDELAYRLITPDSLSISAGSRFNFGFSDNFRFEGRQLVDFNVASLPTFSSDLGIVYEFRPNIERYRYEMDGKTRLRPDETKYLARVGIALYDLGGIRFSRNAYSRSVRIPDNTGNQTNDLNVSELELFDVYDVRDTIESRFTSTAEQTEFFLRLPTHLMISADVAINERFYVGFITRQQIVNTRSTLQEADHYTLIPRMENKWGSVMLPLQYSGLDEFHAGVGFRIGPLSLGSGTLLSNLLRNEINAFDLYLSLSVPIFERVKPDRDGDAVSNRLDRCPGVPGVWDFRGCPDRDSDGVEDQFDECPNIAGLPQFSGCPDTDGDGIEDWEDECIALAGQPRFGGCPDSDNDGIEDRLDYCPQDSGFRWLSGCPDADRDSIPDSQDRCPQTPGLAEFAGCPDTDRDGVPDEEDQCVERFGLKRFNGCPDTDEDGVPDPQDSCASRPGTELTDGCPDSDADGIFDHLDDCPLQAGLERNGGCPLADSDGDGLADRQDRCPLIAGPKANNGCPDLKADPAARQAVAQAEDRMSFRPGSGVLKPEGFRALLELADMLKRRPHYHLRLRGHTDNLGNREYNLRLSEERAAGVKQFLVKSGVAANRLHTEGLGPDEPLRSNATAQGRAINRRVELHLFTP